jgi:hypothetical protein
MTQITKYTICFMLAGLISGAAFAQSTPSTSESKYEPRSLNDRTVSDRLQKDLYTRNSNIANQPITWYDMGDGYYGTYSSNNQNYMTRYDKKGSYIETMTKKEWNDNVPESVKNSFNSSNYKGQQVTGFWEVTDTDRKGYYLELSDDKGKVSRVWANDKGELSTKPYGSRPRN